MLRKIILFLFLSTFVFGGPLKPPKGTVLNFGGNPYRRGLVGVWLMNEGSGSIVQDLSGNRKDGVFTVGGEWTAGKYGPATGYDGVDDYITIDDTDNLLFGSTTMSCSIWVNFRALYANSVRHLFGKLSGNGWQFTAQTSGGGTALEVQWNSRDPVSTGTGLVINRWYNFTGTYDGTTLKIYIDGVLKNTGVSANRGPSVGGDIIIGGTPAGDFVNFELSHAMLWPNRTLTASEIAKLYQNQNIIFDQQEVPHLRMVAGPAAPAGGGQIIMIQMSAIPAIFIIGFVLMLSKGRKTI